MKGVLLLGCTVVALAGGAAVCERGFASADWKLGRYTTRTGDVVVVDIPVDRPDSGAATLPYDFSKFGSRPFEATIKARGFNLTKPTPGWLGFKFMATYRDRQTGQNVYPGARQISGTFPWQTVVLTDATFSCDGTARRDAGQFTLGLQGGGGRVEFDLSTMVVRELPPLWPTTNEAVRCAYTSRVRDLPVHKGVMLGHGLKESDFKDLHAWGVTLARFQMSRDWNTPGGNRDLADYDRYIDSCLDDLENHLAWAKKYGIKIVVDLHAAPGARDANYDLAMCHDTKYADHFIATWRKIATRFRGRPGIFGFDLVNEPQQAHTALPGCDYWSIQSRAAEAIRAIDPETPIIIESNHYDATSAFAFMMPLALTNVIYQAHMYVPMEFTHQGVFDKNAPATVYPDAAKGWNIDLIRKTLAPVREFQQRHGARIYMGEFSAIVWGEGAADYLRDCISVFDEYGWDWSYHAFREWNGWSIEHEATPAERGRPRPSADNPRKRVLLESFAR